MNKPHTWTDEELKHLKDFAENKNFSWSEIGHAFGVDGESARTRYRRLTKTTSKSYSFTPIEESPYPKYDKPLEQTGDCLILPDPEFPYHNADFINRCIDLALSWKITKCNIAGDAMHFNSISKFEANWRPDSSGDLSDKAHKELMNFLPKLPKNLQDEYLNTLERLEPTHDDDIGGEVQIAKRAFLNLSSAFDEIVYVIGNHDGRLLSALNSPMFADQLKQFTVGDNPKFLIAPYYFSILHTENGDYTIEHPVGSSAKTAVNISIQKHCHVLMGHSHRYSRLRDPSDKFWCIQMGMCVDENRLAYASQRTRGAEKHSLGATIVRDGFPYDLSINTPWELWKKL